MEADEPWQTLACCMEVAQAVRSPDPAAYISHLPVHQVGPEPEVPRELAFAVGSYLKLGLPCGTSLLMKQLCFMREAGPGSSWTRWWDTFLG